MGVITVQVERAPETRTLLERVMGNAAIEVDPGQRARDLLDERVDALERRAGPRAGA